LVRDVCARKTAWLDILWQRTASRSLMFKPKRDHAKEASKRPSVTCPFCMAQSFNPHDVEHRYCGRCHVFIDDELARRKLRPIRKQA
jgi:ribosomal protein S27AE